MDQYARKIKQMFNGVHGQAREGPDIYVVVMQIMNIIIERTPMRDAVNRIEMQLPDDGDETHQQDKINGVITETDIGNEMIGIGPKCHNFIGCPDWYCAEHSPKNIVIKLVAKQEDWVVTRQPFVGVFEISTLVFDNVKPQMPSTCHCSNHDKVANENIRDPVKAESFHRV